jgi:transcriptional regulator with XRE-family HTH domain
MSTRATRQNGRALRAIRELHMMSAETLGAMTGSSTQTIRNVENEHRPASEDLLEKIAWALHVTPEVLLRDPPKITSNRSPVRFADCVRSRGAA